MIRASVLLAVILLVPLRAEAPLVSYCELADQSRQYDGSLVRTRASVFSDGESTFLYDLACNGRDAYAELAIDCPAENACGDLVERVQAFYAGSDRNRARADVFLLGRLDDWNGVGYGPVGELRVRFRVSGVEALEPLGDEEPWPDQAGRIAAPFLDAIQTLRQADERLCAALAVGAQESLAGLTTAEYVFTRPGESFTSKAAFLEGLRPLCEGEERFSCAIDRADLPLGLGTVSGRLQCEGGNPLAYAQTYSPSEAGWKATKGQLQSDLQQGAAELLRQLTFAFDADHEYRQADFADFPAAYRPRLQEIQQRLEGNGFQYLGTREDLTQVRVDPNQVNLMSLFLSADGTVTAELGVVAGHGVVSLVGEFVDGRLVATSNAQLDVLSRPPEFDVVVLSFETPVDQVLGLHEQRRASQRYSETRPVVLGVGEVEQAFERRFRVFREHRISVGYLTKSEMERMMGKQPRELLLEPLWEEFQRLVEAHRKTLGQPGR